MFWDTKLSKTSHIFAALTSSALTPYYSYRAQEVCSTSHFLAALTSSALTPYYSYRAQEICSTSHLSIASRPAAGNTCVSMTKMRILGQKSRQNDRFQAEFSKFFRKPQGGLYGCSMMYFDVLELWEPSWNDSGSIWDHSFFHDFSQNFRSKMQNL